MNKFKLLSILFLIFSVNYLSAQTWKSFNSSNSGLPNNMVNSIALSSDGTVWFATDSGLTAYKNNVWQVFTDESVLSVNNLNTVTFLPNDAKDIWVGSDSGLVILNVDSTEILGEPLYINKENASILSDTVNSVELDGFTNNWVGTEKGLTVITNSGIYNFSRKNGLESNVVNALKVLPDNWVHIATQGGGVSRLKYNGVDGITSASRIETAWSFLPSDTVLTIYVTDDTLYWYGTTRGVANFFGENSKSNNWWVYNSFSSEIIDDYVRAIVRDNDGNMWFGTRKGLSKLNTENNSWISYTVDDGLISNNIFDLEVDDENNIWIATDKGLSVFNELSTAINSDPLPHDFKLNISAYPNPFNPQITINYSLPLNGKSKMSVFNLNGQLIEVLFDGFKLKGNYQLNWNASNSRKEIIASGIYILLLENNNSFISKKIIFMK